MMAKKYIEVEDAIEAVWDRYDSDKWGRTPKTEEIVEAIKRVPVVDVAEVVNARWVFKNHIMQDDDEGGWVCSNCGTGVWCIEPKRWRRCPFCEAKMEGIDNDD